MTSPTSDGPSYSERLEARVGEHADAIESFARQRGLPEPRVRAIDHHLGMTRSELRALSATDLAEVAFEISAYAYYLQDQVNLAQVRVDKMTHEIHKLVIPAAAGRGLYKFEDNLALATLEDRAARELADLRLVAQGYLTRWSNLGFRLADLAKRIDILREEKRQRG